MPPHHKSKYFLPGPTFFALMCSFLLIVPLFSRSQTLNPKSVDSILTKIGYYGIKTARPVLFTHFDKTIYTPNENVWFTAYLINAIGHLADYNILSVALVKDDDRAIVAADKFIMSRGIAFGNLVIPDSVVAGNYSFVVYTNHLANGQPSEIFTQPVTIKSVSGASFNATLFVMDTAKTITADFRKVMLMVNAANLAIPGASINYSMGSLIHPFSTGKAVTDKAGEYEFHVPVKLISPGKNNLRVQIKYGKETKEVSVALPASPPETLVRFYPEGGNLIYNVSTMVGWEVKNVLGMPLKVTGIVYKDKRPIDTIETNSFGLGHFTLREQTGSDYTLKLFGRSRKDTTYKLPLALDNVPVLHIAHAIVNDTLVMRLYNITTGKFYLVGHNYRDTYFSQPVEVGPEGKTVRVLLTNMPKGLAEVTVLDSTGRPCSERLFFAHYDRKAALDIHTDQQEYVTRQKVNLKLTLHSVQDQNSAGLVSIACVQDNRVELRKMNDIESYVYLKHEMDALPLKENYMGNSLADKQYLEDLLLIKGWRRYSWTDMLKSNAADTVRRFESPEFIGTITHFFKPLKKPVSLVMMRDSNLRTYATNSIGDFKIPAMDLVLRPDTKVTMIVSGTTSIVEYNINLKDPYLSLNKSIAHQIEPEEFFKGLEQTTESIEVKGFEHATHLREVQIKAKNDDSLYPGTNACGDYVCLYNVLNCPNHRFPPLIHPPVVGQMYVINGQLAPYRACDPNAHNGYALIRGIYESKEFYPSDYSIANPSQPDYVSTLYWKHLVRLNAGKDVDLAFYTGDITGRFRIIVQGITNTDVVYGTHTFDVVKKDSNRNSFQ